MNRKISSFQKLSVVWKIGSLTFHSMVVDEKSEFLSCSALRTRILFAFVIMQDLFFGVIFFKGSVGYLIFICFLNQTQIPNVTILILYEFFFLADN